MRHYLSNILCADYGWSSTVPVSSCYSLIQELVTIPPHAVLCKLINVKPSSLLAEVRSSHIIIFHNLTNLDKVESLETRIICASFWCAWNLNQSTLGVEEFPSHTSNNIFLDSIFLILIPWWELQSKKKLVNLTKHGNKTEQHNKNR